MFMMGDGWNDKTNEPPCDIPPEFDESITSHANGLWFAPSHGLLKALEDRRDDFERELARVFCAFLRPCKSYEFPFNG
jgi:hypothetical protein